MKFITNGLVVTKDNEVIEGYDITNIKGGVGLKITGNNVTVKNCYIHDTKDHGVMFLGTNGGTLENCEITRCAMRSRPNTISGGWPSLVKVQSVDESPNGLAQNIVIRNNYIHHGWGEGMGLRGSHIEVYGNTVEDCYSFGIYSNSDNTYIHGNFVVARDKSYYRSGYPMAGIGGAEETFAKWGAHGHDTHTVVNNIVLDCKHGYRFGRSDNKKGLVDTVIAYNTFAGCKSAPVSITYYPNQRGIRVENNLSNKPISVRGAALAGNVVKQQAGYAPEDFKLSAPVPAMGAYWVVDDFGHNARLGIPDVGAWEYSDR